MKLVIWNSKGGVGKTIIAYNIARTLKYWYLTNDVSIASKIYSLSGERDNFDDVIDIEEDIVFDFGGFLDKNIIVGVINPMWYKSLHIYYIMLILGEFLFFRSLYNVSENVSSNISEWMDG